MKIHQIYTQSFLRNFSYIIELEDRSAMVIDPWEAGVVNSLLAENNLRLTTIINTHEYLPFFFDPIYQYLIFSS